MLPGLFCQCTSGILTLGELRTLTRFVQTNLFTLNFASITRQKTRLTHYRTQRLIVINQSTSQTMTNRASLTVSATANNSHNHIKLLGRVSGFQRLPHDHTRSLTTEVLIQGTLVYSNIAGTRLDKYTS